MFFEKHAAVIHNFLLTVNLCRARKTYPVPQSRQFMVYNPRMSTAPPQAAPNNALALNVELLSASVEQEKLNPAVSDYLAAFVRQHPFAKDVLVDRRQVVPVLAKFWPPMPGRAAEARQLLDYVDETVRAFPLREPTLNFLLRIVVAPTGLAPLTIPEANEAVSIAAFDSVSGILHRTSVPRAASLPELGYMEIKAGIMVLCQPLPPQMNGYRDTVPLVDAVRDELYLGYTGRNRDKILSGDQAFEPMFPKSMILTEVELREISRRIFAGTMGMIARTKKQAEEKSALAEAEDAVAAPFRRGLELIAVPAALLAALAAPQRDAPRSAPGVMGGQPSSPPSYAFVGVAPLLEAARAVPGTAQTERAAASTAPATTGLPNRAAAAVLAPVAAAVAQNAAQQHTIAPPESGVPSAALPQTAAAAAFAGQAPPAAEKAAEVAPGAQAAGTMKIAEAAETAAREQAAEPPTELEAVNALRDPPDFEVVVERVADAEAAVIDAEAGEARAEARSEAAIAGEIAHETATDRAVETVNETQREERAEERAEIAGEEPHAETRHATSPGETRNGGVPENARTASTARAEPVTSIARPETRTADFVSEILQPGGNAAAPSPNPASRDIFPGQGETAASSSLAGEIAFHVAAHTVIAEGFHAAESALAALPAGGVMGVPGADIVAAGVLAGLAKKTAAEETHVTPAEHSVSLPKEETPQHRAVHMAEHAFAPHHYHDLEKTDQPRSDRTKETVIKLPEKREGGALKLASLLAPGLAAETAIEQLVAKKIVKIAEPEKPALADELKHLHPGFIEAPEENL